MPRFVCLLRLFTVAGLLASAACGGKSTSNGTGGAGGGAAGTGGMSGSGGAPITSCPASMPAGQTTACAGTFNCQLNGFCTCHGCCFGLWGCVEGVFKQTDYNDGCIQGPPCPDGGAVCTFGADQTCNDNPIVSSIHGHCTDAGTCTCTFDAGTNPDSGRCL